MGTRATYIKLINNTAWDIIDSKVYNMDNFDFGETSRPTKNLVHLKIKKGESIREREELTAWATHCPFTIDLNFSNETKDTFTIHQKFAIGCCPGFEHIQKAHKIEYSRHEKETIEIKISLSDENKEDIKADALDREGVGLMIQGSPKEALKKFEEGLKLANTNQTNNQLKVHKEMVEKKMSSKAEK